MSDYSKGKIYTIRCRTDDTKIYVGSTIQPLSKRWGGHKIDSLRGSNMLLYQTINNDWNNWYIELYELYPCNSKEELLKREGQLIREIGNLNKVITDRTPKEYRETHKDRKAETHKEWYEMNKDKIVEKKKEYYESNKEKIFERRKEYFEINKEKLLEKRKEYCEINKDKLIKQNKEKIICECGCEIVKYTLSRHKKTKRHIEYMNSLITK
jgi:hypothetical protein